MIIKRDKTIRRFVPIREGIKFPKASTQYSAGYDIFTPVDIYLEPNQEVVVKTGLRYETTEIDEFVGLYPRSGLGFKYYCRLANTVGIVDADYEGEIMVKVRNESNKKMFVDKGNAICQAIIQQYLRLEPDFRDDIERTGGFGSTDRR